MGIYRGPRPTLAERDRVSANTNATNAEAQKKITIQRIIDVLREHGLDDRTGPVDGTYRRICDGRNGANFLFRPVSELRNEHGNFTSTDEIILEAAEAAHVGESESVKFLKVERPGYQYGTGIIGEILRLTNEAGRDVSNGDDLVGVADEMHAEGLLKLTEEAQRIHNQNTLQARLIDEIAAGKSTYVAIRKFDNSRQTFDVAPLWNKPLDELEEIHRCVMAYRQQDERGRSGDKTKSDDKDQQLLGGVLPTVHHTSEKEQRDAAAVAAQNEQDIFLENPATPGVEFTRKQILNMTREQFSQLIYGGGEVQRKRRMNAVDRIVKQVGA